MSIPLLVLISLFLRKEQLIYNDLVFIYLAISFSSLIVIRDFDAGLMLGYGPDIYSYLNSFNDIQSGKPVFISAFARTGSGEPMFWGVVKFFSLFTSSAYEIWFLINFFVCSLIYYSLRRHSKSLALILVTMYLLTRTFHILSGSAIRQGVAQAFFCVGISFLITGNKNKGLLFSFFSAMCHLSGLFALFAVYLGNKFNRINANLLFKLLFSSIGILIVSLLIFKFFPDSFFTAKITARFLVKNKEEGGYGWLLQFILEAGFVTFLLKVYLPSIFKEKIWISFVFLCIFIILFSPFNYISIRLYRFTYCYYLFFALNVFIVKKNRLFPTVLFILFFIYWQFNLAFKYYPIYEKSYFEALIISSFDVIEETNNQKNNDDFL